MNPHRTPIAMVEWDDGMPPARRKEGGTLNIRNVDAN